MYTRAYTVRDKTRARRVKVTTFHAISFRILFFLLSPLCVYENPPVVNFYESRSHLLQSALALLQKLAAPVYIRTHILYDLAVC